MTRLRRSVLAALGLCMWMTAGVRAQTTGSIPASSPTQAQPCPSTSRYSITVEELVDGRSHLLLSPEGVRWEHFDYEPPGTFQGDWPTYLSLVVDDVVVWDRFPWYADWEDLPFSDLLELPVPLPEQSPAEASLQVLNARYRLEVVHWPDHDNGYVTRLEFNDNPHNGAAWYSCEVLLTYCRADVNDDGSIDTLDFIHFLAAWVNRDPSGDWDCDGTVNSRDFMAYLNDWVAGC